MYICFVFTNAKKLENYFKFKDSIDDSVMSCLVYKFNCNSCNTIYVDKTMRHLAVNISERTEASYGTLISLIPPPFSAIR